MRRRPAAVPCRPAGAATPRCRLRRAREVTRILQRRRGGQHLRHQVRPFQQMLEVVQHQQHLLGARYARSRWRASAAPDPGASSRFNSTVGRTAAALAGARSTNQAPSRKRPASLWAISTARRVLPMPPGPTMVSSRQSAWPVSAQSLPARACGQPGASPPRAGCVRRAGIWPVPACAGTACAPHCRQWLVLVGLPLEPGNAPRSPAPARMRWARMRVAGCGSTANSVASMRTQASYWRRAARALPPAASSHINWRCTSSFHGSSSSSRCVQCAPAHSHPGRRACAQAAQALGLPGGRSARAAARARPRTPGCRPG